MTDKGVTKDCVMKNVNTNKEYTCDAPDETHEVEYPHTFFNAKEKPKLQIRGNSETGLDAYRRAAKAIVVGGGGSIEYVLGYLYEVGKTIEEELLKDWNTFGINIGVKGHKVTPMSLLDVTYDESDAYGAVDKLDPATDAEDHWLLLSLLGAPRLKRGGKNTTVTGALIEAYNQLFKLGTFEYPKDYTFGGIKNFAEVYGEHPGLMALLAAYDMFFYRFQKHDLAHVRLGTIITRHEGCTASTSLSYFVKLINVENVNQAILWAFVSDMGIEFDQMFLHKEEFCNLESYFPYFMALGLSAKSPYSAASNPSIFLLIHLVGSSQGRPRSLNAIMPQNARLGPIAINAAIIILAKKSAHGLGIVMISKQEADAYQKGVADAARLLTAADEKDDPKGKAPPKQKTGPKTASDWVLYYKSKGFSFTNKEIQILKTATQTVRQTREGTVGEWFKEIFMGMIPTPDVGESDADTDSEIED